MPEKSDRWLSAITDLGTDKINVRGYPVQELMGVVSLAGALGLLIKGEIPSPAEERVLEAVLVSSCDHGPSPPSTLAARTAASTGASFSAAIAAGVLSINQFHGGAIEGCMYYLLELDKRVGDSGAGLQGIVNQTVAEYRQGRKRILGFGHRLHKLDPRAVRLREILRAENLYGRHMDALDLTEAALKEASGRVLPLNVDGAAAGALLEIGFPPEAGNVVFIMARVAGLAAHVREETVRGKPMRVIDPLGWSYDGPARRILER
jgi:citrate synthase